MTSTVIPTTVIQWLLTSLREPLAEQKAYLLPCPPEMDWDDLVQYLDHQAIAPLAYSRLQSDAELWSALPPAAQEQLQQRYLYNAQRNLQIYYQFLKLVKTLRLAGIPVIILKGVFLAYAVYEDRALRPMADVDILVRRSDVEGVESALLAAGYQLSQWKHRDWCLKNHYHLSYIHPGVNVNIEIHWHILRPGTPYGLEIEELWQQAQPITMAGVELWALSPEHLLLYQCLHIAKHAFGLGLRHFCDLAAILGRYQGQIDWLQVQREADRWHIAKAVYLSLYFTHEFFGGVAEAPMASLRPATMEPDVLETAREQILSFGSSTARLSTEFLQLWEGENDEQKVPRLLRRVFLPQDVMASLYHVSPDSWRIYLYYPVRLFDLLVRYPQLIHQFMRRDQGTLAWAKETNKVELLRKWLVT